MVIPWLSCGVGSSHSAVCTFVVCNLCYLFFVYQLGYSRVQDLYRECSVFGSLNIFSKNTY